jgi:acetyl esterase/lipase
MSRVSFLLLASLSFLIFTSKSLAAEKPKAPTYKTIKDIAYRPEDVSKQTPYMQERCKLDLYYPEGEKGFPTVVWFHGGGLTGGNKYIPGGLRKKGFAVVGVNYRLHPKVKCPVYLDDAAAAVAWTFKNIAKYGGDPDKIFISGHSAGGYLTSMVGLDKKLLAKYDIDANKIAGLMPLSGHTITHMTVRGERGIPNTKVVVDEFAPLYHARKDAPPLLLITGDRNLEMLGRYEENAYMMRMMKVNGYKDTTLYEIQGYGHSMEHPSMHIMVKFINQKIKDIDDKKQKKQP